MPRLYDRDEIRERLEHDRPWAAYALGDLSPGYFHASEWYGPAGHPDAVALLYRATDTPVLVTCGDPEGVAVALDELPPEPRMTLSIRPEVLPHLQGRWTTARTALMWRMLLPPDAQVLPCVQHTRRIGPDDLPDLLELFRDGRETGEEPDFFAPSMLADGTYYGAWKGERLIAAAGTHLVAPTMGIAALGNVYTRRECRGQGHGRAVTAAVVAELRRQSVPIIVLNVRQRNAAALRVYESLGFRRYCPFYEGLAELPKKY